jgi:hypothetical protein
MAGREGTGRRYSPQYADLWGLRGDNSIAYLCGHPEMIARGKGILERVGFRRKLLREESYWVPDKLALTCTR